MSRILGLAILIPLGAIAVSFGASNGDWVALRLFPLPGEISLPLASVIFCALFFGVVLGGIAAWFGAGVVRNRARSAERAARARERELQEMRRKFAEAAVEATSDGPAAIDIDPTRAKAGLLEAGGSRGRAA